ncbi:MAG: hypothetical protein U1E86_20325 [Burkholderiaceae bacterium]
MRMGIASLLAALFLAGAAWAQPAGTWLLVDRKEVINGPNERVAPNCNWRGDSGDKGMRLYISCYSSVSRATVVSSAAVSWEFPIGFERLRSGSSIALAGVVDNASTPKTGPSATCSLAWNYSLRITTGGRPSRARGALRGHAERARARPEAHRRTHHGSVARAGAPDSAPAPGFSAS